jgi:hypothetical protein
MSVGKYVHYYFSNMFWLLIMVAILREIVDMKEHLMLKHVVVNCP